MLPCVVRSFAVPPSGAKGPAAFSAPHIGGTHPSSLAPLAASCTLPPSELLLASFHAPLVSVALYLFAWQHRLRLMLHLA